MHQKPGR